MGRWAALGLAFTLLVCFLVAAAVRLPWPGSSEARALGEQVTAPPTPAALATALAVPTVALVGALAAPAAALVGTTIAGPVAGLAAGLLIALSPIHALASRDGAPHALLVLALVTVLGLVESLDSRGHRVAAMLAALAAVTLAVAPTLMGLVPGPFALGIAAEVTPSTSAQSLVRCAGASFTRVLGIEYQYVVPQARYALPVSVLFVGLVFAGSRQLLAGSRLLLALGAIAPFGLGAVMAVVTGHVAPLQAHRLVAALPFLTLLLSVGLASLRGVLAWAAGLVVFGTVGASLVLALFR